MLSTHIKQADRKVRVAVADDHPVIVLAIADAFESLPGFLVVTRAHSGAELLRELKVQQVDLIVTDLVMNGEEDELDGLRLIERLRRDYPEVRIVVFTMLTSGAMFHELCKLGVAAIVGKEDAAHELGRICQLALVEKEPILSPTIRERIAREGATQQDFSRVQPLSPKELEVVRLFSQGMSVTQIAKTLKRAVPTIATQKRSAMRKLHIENHADLVKYAAERGLA
ncbi:MAG: response regulator transcription factor [Pseudomonadota bacterium]|jgi:two-component system capsular synthesis response regulator RcsB|uniref:response regulator transcription factor n=1 Tax=Burkholderiaceae TaxID=119060 RepID=UPI0014854F72|nr:response regulator transcription factor [Burkholderia sp. 4M9327F10]